MISVEEARELIENEARAAEIQEIDLTESTGLVVAEDISADRDYPPFHRSTMDGYALSSADFNSHHTDSYRVTQDIFAGSTGQPIGRGECARIMTGAPVPEGADAVIRREDSSPVNGDRNMVRFSIDRLPPWKDISRRGEDVTAGSLLISSGTWCSPPLVNTLASLGRERIRMRLPPTTTILTTGDEILPLNRTPLNHQIRDSNSFTLRAFLKEYRIEARFPGIVPDDKSRLSKAIEEGLHSNILILTGGVSMGDADYVPEILASLGVRNIFHRVRVKPGKPLWFGRGDEGVVFGLPGNPVACQVGFKLFIEPYIRRSLGLPPLKPLFLPLAGDIEKKGDREHYIPCRIVGEGESLLQALPFRGSGDMRATLQSDGVARLPADERLLRSGTILLFFPWRAL